MKKYIMFGGVIAITVILIIGIIILGLTGMFTRGKITGKLYRVDNVYEEIWNLVNAERRGGETVLTTAVEGSYVDYDLGFFEGIKIPADDDYRISLTFWNDELSIYIYAKDIHDHNNARYVYNYETNTLYGNHEESFLHEKFTSLYYSWVGNDGKFTPENQGDYTFVFDEHPLSHN